MMQGQNMQELKWKVPLPHEQRDMNDKEGTCETARPGGRALLIAQAGEDTRPCGKLEAVPSFS